MLNDVGPPPPDPDDPVVPTARPGPLAGRVDPHVPRNPLVRPHEHMHPHVEPKEVGQHKRRIVGERTHIDPEYAMPMEDRGSAFSLGLSAVVVGVFALLVIIVWISFFRG